MGRSLRVAVSAGSLMALSGLAIGQSVSYSTPYTPGTPSSLQISWSGILDAASPTWRRTNGSGGTETNPTPPTTLGGTASSVYAYGVQSFTPSVSGLYQFFSAQAHDGYLHLYQNAFDPMNGLTNVVAADDDMTALNAGSVPNRNGVAGAADSGFQVNLTAGTSYFIVNSTFSASVPLDGHYYNEIYGGGTPASPLFAIPDNDPTGVTLSLNIPSSETGTIASMDSVDLFGFTHTFASDLIVTLTHMETGTSAILMNEVGGSGDLVGDYSIIDGGAAFTGTPIAPGAYGGSESLSIFNGEALAGTWLLTITDGAGQDTGAISAFGLNVTIPTPGALALMGLGGLMAVRRRR